MKVSSDVLEESTASFLIVAEFGSSSFWTRFCISEEGNNTFLRNFRIVGTNLYWTVWEPVNNDHFNQYSRTWYYLNMIRSLVLSGLNGHRFLLRFTYPEESMLKAQGKRFFKNLYMECGWFPFEGPCLLYDIYCRRVCD